jgi:excisionase family DNA binding protein
MFRGHQLEIFDQPGAGVDRPLPNGSARSNGSLMTAAEVADLLGVPPSWVYEQSRRGRIPTVTLGRYRRYRREAIETWLEELEGHTPDGRARPLAY